MLNIFWRYYIKGFNALMYDSCGLMHIHTHTQNKGKRVIECSINKIHWDRLKNKWFSQQRIDEDILYFNQFKSSIIISFIIFIKYFIPVIWSSCNEQNSSHCTDKLKHNKLTIVWCSYKYWHKVSRSLTGSYQPSSQYVHISYWGRKLQFFNFWCNHVSKKSECESYLIYLGNTRKGVGLPPLKSFHSKHAS